MKISKIICAVMIIVGLGCLAYPTVSNFIQNSKNSSMIEEYENTVSNMTFDEKQHIVSDIENYNNNLKDDKVQDISYNDVMSIKGFMGYIDIPKVNVYLPIYSSTSDFVLKNGIGHLQETSLPYGGLGTHCVLTGHTGLAENRLFTDIDKLETGDMFYIHILGETHAYQVDNISVVLPSEITSFDIYDDKDLVTLLTCTPYGVNTHRLLITGSRIPYENIVIDSSDEKVHTGIDNTQKPMDISAYKDNLFLHILCLICFVTATFGLVIFIKLRHRRFRR